MVESQGLGWREAVYSRLKPVTRQGAATVWTIPDDASTRLLSHLTKDPAARIIQAPRVTSFSGAAATIQCRSNARLVTQAAWNGEEPAPAVAPENVRVGWHTTLIGRKLDQGILVQIVFEDTAIRALHHVEVQQSTEPKCTAAEVPERCGFSGIVGKSGGFIAIAQAALGKEADDEQDCDGHNVGCESSEKRGKGPDVQKVSLDVPEIDTHEVVGEWLIPRGEVLLVSFGAFTVADKDGKAVVKERLALIEADLVTNAAPLAAPGPLKPAPAPVFTPPAASLPAPLPKIVMPSPVMPSRTIPQGVHADGTPAELPPLPADETETDSSASESSQPMPSPQTKKTQQPKPATDSGASKAEFAQPKSPTLFLPSLFLPSRSVGFQFLLPIKPLSFKLPLGQRLEIEIFGRVVPDADR